MTIVIVIISMTIIITSRSMIIPTKSTIFSRSFGNIYIGITAVAAALASTLAFKHKYCLSRPATLLKKNLPTRRFSYNYISTVSAFSERSNMISVFGKTAGKALQGCHFTKRLVRHRLLSQNILNV